MTKTTLPRKSTRIATAVSLLTVLLMSAPATAANNADLNQIDLYKEWLANQYGAIPVYDAQNNNWTLKPLVRSMQTYGLLSRGHSSYGEIDRTYFGGNAIENPYDPTKSLVPTEEKEKKKFKKAGISISEGGSSLGILKRPINVVQGTDIVIPIPSIHEDKPNISIPNIKSNVTVNQPKVSSFSTPEIDSLSSIPPRNINTPNINVVPPHFSTEQVTNNELKSIPAISFEWDGIPQQDPIVPTQVKKPEFNDLSFPSSTPAQEPTIGKITPPNITPPTTSSRGAYPNSPKVYFGPRHVENDTNHPGYFIDVSLKAGDFDFPPSKKSIWKDVIYDTKIISKEPGQNKLTGLIVDEGSELSLTDDYYNTDKNLIPNSADRNTITFDFDKENLNTTNLFFYTLIVAPYAKLGDSHTITAVQEKFNLKN